MNNEFIFFFTNNTKRNLKYIYSFFLGITLVACFPPFNFWPLLFPSLTFIFLKSYNAESKKDAFLIGWFFGLSFFMFSLYWIFNSFLIRSGIYILLLPICLFSFSCFLALFIGFVTYLNYKFRTNLIFNIIFFSIFWTFSEILRGYLLTGFPWNLLSHTLSNFDILIQICSVVGVYGLTFFVVYFILSLSIFILNFNKKREYFLFLSSIFIFVSIFFYGINRLNSSNLTTYSSDVFRVVQPNINQIDKLNISKIENNYKKLMDASFSSKMSSLNKSENLVIFWPETAIFNFNHIYEYSVFKKLNNNLKENEYVITGIFRNEDKDYYNSISIIDRNLSVEFIYDKIHLVPFGEYIPFSNFLNFFGFNFLNLKKGFENQKIVKYKDLPKFRPLICYESIFPGKFIKNENDPILLVNFTNDAWFGNTIGPYQHFVNSKFRAIEEGKHLIRVANTGISSSIDPLGRVLKKLSLNSSGYFDTKIFIANKNNTPIKTIFSKYKNNLVIVLLIILFFLFSILKYQFYKREEKN